MPRGAHGKRDDDRDRQNDRDDHRDLQPCGGAVSRGLFVLGRFRFGGFRQGVGVRREFKGNEAFFFHVAELAVVVDEIHVIAVAVVGVAVIFERSVFKDVADQILCPAVGVKAAGNGGAERHFAVGRFGIFVGVIKVVRMDETVDGGRGIVPGEQLRARHRRPLFRDLHVIGVRKVKEEGSAVRVLVKPHVVFDHAAVCGVGFRLARRYGEYENERAGERRAH